MPAGLSDATLLIADGHHRYETALAFHAEEGTDESAWLLAVVCPTEQEGLTIFPTHRIAAHVDDTEGRDVPSVEAGFASLAPGRSGTVLYRTGRVLAIEGEPGEPDTALVDRLEPEGVEYTADLAKAVAAVDSGDGGGGVARSPAADRARP